MGWKKTEECAAGLSEGRAGSMMGIDTGRDGWLHPQILIQPPTYSSRCRWSVMTMRRDRLMDW